MARTAKTQKNGLHASVDRFVLLRVLGVALMITAVIALASSTITDPIQHLIDDSVLERNRITNGAPDDNEQLRMALLRRTARDADAVRRLSPDELKTLLGEPSLKRTEGEAVSWHFTSPDCALDIYFPKADKKPAYAEFRVRGAIEDSGLVEEKRKLDHKACLKSLYASARI